MNVEPERVDLHLHLPTKTIIKVLLTALLVWAGLRLWPEFVFVLISITLAVALHPAVVWLEKRGLSRGAVIVLMALALLGVLALLVGVVFTSLADQISRLVADFPGFRARVEQRLPTDYPILRKVVAEIFALPYSPEVAAQLKRPLAWGKTALSGSIATFFTLILTLYFLLDGKHVYAWLIAYIPRIHRDRMAVTMEEVSVVVYTYVRGQVINSVLFATYVAILLHALKVPAALPLAVLAGMCDVIPVLGIIIATVPAVVLALVVSPAAAAIVLAAYIVYHVIETYFIVPKVYGERMRLSTLALLLALVAGSTLQGLIGAVLVLPLVAAYPIIERIWLVGYLSPEVIKDHKALAKSAETGSEKAVDAVLHGAKHPWEAPTGNVVATWKPEQKTEGER